MTKRTIEAARAKIAQIADATDEGDLIHRHGVASGWLAALRLERLIDEAAFRELAKELDDTFYRVGPL